MKKKYLIALCVMSVAFVGYFSVFKNAVLTCDDFFYILGSKDGIGGAFSFFVEHYFEWSGRFAHFIDILFLMSEGLLWRILTPALLAGLPFLAFYFIQLRLPESLSDYLGIGLIYGLMSTFSDLYTVQMLYWHTACITYFYFPFAMMLYLLPFRKLLSGKDAFSGRRFEIFVYAFGGFVLGFSQEVVGAITAAFIFCTIAYQFYLKKKIKTVEIASFVFTLIGFVLLLKAPGNQIRLTYFDWWTTAEFTTQVKHALGYFIFNQYHVQWIIWSVFLGLLLLFTFKQNKKVGLFCSPIMICCFVLIIFNTCEHLFTWDVIKAWKYSTDYFYMNSSEVLAPVVLFSLSTVLTVLMGGYCSYKKKDPLLFVLVCAVFCSNLTTLASPVGTSYISFPGIMITFAMMIYMIRDFSVKKEFVFVVMIMVSCVLGLKLIHESERMATIAKEEMERREILEQGVQQELGTITIPAFSERVWDGDTITFWMKEYYGVPEWIQVVVTERSE